MSFFKRRKSAIFRTYSAPPCPAAPGAAREPPDRPGRAPVLSGVRINVIRRVCDDIWCLRVSLKPCATARVRQTTTIRDKERPGAGAQGAGIGSENVGNLGKSSQNKAFQIRLPLPSGRTRCQRDPQAPDIITYSSNNVYTHAGQHQGPPGTVGRLPGGPRRRGAGGSTICSKDRGFSP